MEPQIIYLQDLEELVSSLNNKNIEKTIFNLINFFDYAGGIVLPSSRFKNHVKMFSPKIQNMLETFINTKEDKTHLRSKEYYLNFSCNNEINKVRQKIPEKLNEIYDSLEHLESKIDLSNFETRLLLAALYDHKKHYSMSIFNSYYLSLVKGDKIDLKNFESVEEICIQDIVDFYKLVLKGEAVKPQRHTKESLDFFSKELRMPEPTLPSVSKPLGEPTARKIIIREMDHPIQIILFGGQLLREDGTKKIDFVVNPLSGALEIGYALKSIYELLGIDKIGEILLIKYSKYGEGDEIKENIEPFVPENKKRKLQQFKGRRILIIDDNTFTGNTLYELKEMCKSYSNNVGISAIERRTDIDEKRKIEYEELDIKPISKLRYIEKVMRYIQENNLA